MAMASEELLKRLIGEKAIVIHFRRHISKEKNNYKIYLPKSYAPLWEYLRSCGKDIEILVIVKPG